MRRAENIMLLAVLLAFVAAMSWLLRRTEMKVEPEYAPLTTLSPRPDGSLALYELCEVAGLHPRRFDDSEYYYPASGCMVIMDMYGQFPMPGDAVDAKALRLWLERGGRLVIASNPELDEYSMAHGLFKELDALDPVPQKIKDVSDVGVEGKLARKGTKGKLTSVSRAELDGEVYGLPKSRPMLFAGVDKLEHAKGVPTLVQGVLLLRTDGPVLWYRKVGKGELYWLDRPELATNSWIARADNHRLLLNLLATASRGRQLYFDEHIHGYQREAPNMLALLVRTHGGHLLLLLCALTLLLFAGAAVRPAKYVIETVPERRAGVEMVLAQADLYERAGARHVIADSQVDSLRRAYMERRHLASPPSEQQLLAWLEEADAGGKVAPLAEYLRHKLIPSASGLLELAHACDAARAMLT